MSGWAQFREWGRPAERVRKTPNKRQFRCGAEDARLVPGPDLSTRSIKGGLERPYLIACHHARAAYPVLRVKFPESTRH